MMKIQSGVTTILMLMLLLCAEIPVHAADKKLTSLLAPMMSGISIFFIQMRCQQM
ncbi:hypothetical protein [Salmonella enterica]|uniref:hypothetical protein n=1 Tax=Salmonella enterica TaxID=28901 RepID=UPI0039A4448B